MQRTRFTLRKRGAQATSEGHPHEAEGVPVFHFRRAGALIAATTTTAMVLTATPFAAAAEADQVTINVANITDFHGRLKANPSKDKTTGEPVWKTGDEMGAANVAGIMNYLLSLIHI